MTRHHLVSALAGCAACAAPALAQDVRVRPEIAVEGRAFVSDPQFEDQFDGGQFGLVLGGEASWTSEDRNWRILFEPYLRLDSRDDERTYFDIREASVSYRFGDWDALVGVSQVFFGVAESRNVVDIVNQFDTVEGGDEEEKLGQPMIRLSRRGDFGAFEVFYLPVFREREFPGSAGRLRTALPVDEEAAAYQRSGDEVAGDFALRYTNRFGDFDVGAHAFYGTSREPLLRISHDGRSFEPFYQELAQGGLDVQYTTGSWLLKLEAVGKRQGGDVFASTVGGVEYTVFDVAASGVDVGLIGEYLYDSRDPDRAPASPFENDAFVGTRLTFNDVEDTEILAGAFVDTETGGLQLGFEFERRIGSDMLLETEARFIDASGDPLLQPVEDDGFLQLRLTKFF